MAEATNILELIKQYWPIILIIGLGIVVFFLITKLKSKHKPVVINRGLLEKQRRIKDLKYNPNTITIEFGGKTYYPKMHWLFHGKKRLGLITNIHERTDKDNIKFFEIVFNSQFPYYIFSKKDIIRIAESSLLPLREDDKKIIIWPSISIDSHEGQYFDVPFETKNINWINEQLYKHDKEANSSFYEVESQKRATFDIMNASIPLDMEEKRIQAEMMRKKGYMDTM